MKKDKYIDFVFIILFLMMIVVPLFLTNLKDNVVSESENRYLAAKAKLYTEDGTINSHFLSDFESWINDNIGLRTQMVVLNAKIQYHLFKVLSNNTDMYLGPKGELNYATNEIITDYQHNNLYSQEYCTEYANSMQEISDYVEESGRKFYYFQCWDKQSIYPEYFPTAIVQHGDASKTDLLVESLMNNTSVDVVSPKKQLIDAKKYYDTYSRWGDPTHWTTRGAIIGYNSLLTVMNEHEGTDYKILTDEDFNISITDQGTTVFGGIHETDYLELFEFKKNYEVTNTNEKLTAFADDPRSAYFVNPKAESDKTVLLVADSYFAEYCLWDFAYTFKNVIFIHADHVEDLPLIMDSYYSDYVIFERAERVDSSQAVINTAQAIRDTYKPYKVFLCEDLFVDDDSESENIITIRPGHIQYGPYAPIEKGKYKVVVFGRGFESLNESSIYINPNSWYEVLPTNILIDKNIIEYVVDFADDLYKLELGIRNNSDYEVVVEKVEVYRTK